MNIVWSRMRDAYNGKLVGRVSHLVDLSDGTRRTLCGQRDVVPDAGVAVKHRCSRCEMISKMKGR